MLVNDSIVDEDTLEIIDGGSYQEVSKNLNNTNSELMQSEKTLLRPPQSSDSSINIIEGSRLNL